MKARLRTGKLPLGLAALFAVNATGACSGADEESSSDGDRDLTHTGGELGGDGELPGDGGTTTGGFSGDGDVGTGGGDGDGDLGSGGLGGDGDINPTPQFILSEENGLYVYSLGASSMTIDPNNGARVLSFVVDGQETLVQAGSGPAHYGSVFWPSPQEDWVWPPPAEIDSGSYTPMVNGDELTLASATNAALGLAVTTTFAPTVTIGGTPGISVSYTLHNDGVSPRSVAGWEVSRVSAGTAFYPTGPGGLLGISTLALSEIGAHTWYNHAGGNMQKSFGDGSGGWLAWSTGTALAVKTFVDIPQGSFASNEAEIEIYAGGNYFEVEQQGPVTSVPPGGFTTWNVIWVGVTIPAGTDTSLGSTDLTTLVTNAL